MNIDWTDTGVLAADPDHSAIAGRVGFFMLPGSRAVWNPGRGRWDRLDRVRHVPFLAFGGWIAAVPADSRAIDAAWDYIGWYAGPAHSAADVLDGTSGINPYRYSHLEEDGPWRGLFGETRPTDYLTVIRRSLDSPDVARDLRIPGFRAYMDALDVQIERALAGEFSPQAALDAAAARWEEITDRLGRANQRRFYRSAMGLGD
jgi:multiple sugar transport system substrate-binding protein